MDRLNGWAMTEFAMIGLRRMGANLARRLALGGTRLCLFDQNQATAASLAAVAEPVPVPAPVMSLALMMRFSSRGNGDYAAKILAKMREGFGGHAVRTNRQPG
jgi:6-phosphogluconate dehydrogenase